MKSPLVLNASAALIALSLVGCSDKQPTATTNTPTPSSTDGVVKQIIKRHASKGFSVNGSNLQMRDGNLVLSENEKEFGTITPDGALTIDGQPVALTADQQVLTRKLHAQAVQMTSDAIDIAGAATGVATAAVSDGVKLAVAAALSGNGNDTQREKDFENKIESTVRDQIKPAALKICQSSNAMEQTRQQLAAAVPAYAKHYVKDEPCDVAELERDFAKKEDHPSSTP